MGRLTLVVAARKSAARDGRACDLAASHRNERVLPPKLSRRCDSGRYGEACDLRVGCSVNIDWNSSPRHRTTLFGLNDTRFMQASSASRAIEAAIVTIEARTDVRLTARCARAILAAACPTRSSGRHGATSQIAAE
jgi:hypothetical protein